MISFTIQSVSSAEMRTTFFFITLRTDTIGLLYHGSARADKPRRIRRRGAPAGAVPWSPYAVGSRRRARARPPTGAAGDVLPGGRAPRRAARAFDLLHHRGGGAPGLLGIRAPGLARLPEPAGDRHPRRAAGADVARVRRVAAQDRHGADHEQAARRARLRAADFGFGPPARAGARARPRPRRAPKVTRAERRW